jgi:hypothetical protein
MTSRSVTLGEPPTWRINWFSRSLANLPSVERPSTKLRITPRRRRFEYGPNRGCFRPAGGRLWRDVRVMDIAPDDVNQNRRLGNPGAATCSQHGPQGPQNSSRSSLVSGCTIRFRNHPAVAISSASCQFSRPEVGRRGQRTRSTEGPSCCVGLGLPPPFSINHRFTNPITGSPICACDIDSQICLI